MTVLLLLFRQWRHVVKCVILAANRLDQWGKREGATYWLGGIYIAHTTADGSAWLLKLCRCPDCLHISGPLEMDADVNFKSRKSYLFERKFERKKIRWVWLLIYCQVWSGCTCTWLTSNLFNFLHQILHLFESHELMPLSVFLVNTLNPTDK